MRFGWKVLLPVATINAVDHRARGGVAPDDAAVSNTLKGFGVTFKQIFKKPITQQYPEYKRPVYPRFRGRHRLRRHENGLEKCVGCSLCAAACPADCIRVVAAENTPDNRVSAGERYARIYEINMSRCIFCGYCELACPFDAITLGNEYEISEYNRDDQIYTKDMLLAEPVKQVPVADRGALRHADPLLQVRLVILASAGNVLVWMRLGRSPASRASRRGARRRRLLEPVLLGALADREPRLARGALPAARRRSSSPRRRCSSTRGAVMVMFLFVIAYLGDRARRRRGRAGRAGRPSRDRARGRRRSSLEIIVASALKAGGVARSTPARARAVRHAGLDRPAVPDRPPARVRDHLDRAARRRRRRRRPRLAREARARARRRPPDARARRRLVPRARRVPVRDRRARRAASAAAR